MTTRRNLLHLIAGAPVAAVASQLPAPSFVQGVAGELLIDGNVSMFEAFPSAPLEVIPPASSDYLLKFTDNGGKLIAEFRHNGMFILGPGYTPTDAGNRIADMLQQAIKQRCPEKDRPSAARLELPSLASDGSYVI